MLHIDGRMGEGGGQILRSSLALSAITNTPYVLDHIRGKRSNPGLQAQHLCSVRAAARVCNALVTGDELRSSELSFEPQDIVGGYFEFDIGTAGSCSLVLQTILPMFLHARCQAELRIRGGTHNPWSPSIDFIQSTFIPLLKHMGADIELTVETPGFYPKGGGCIHVRINTEYFGKDLHVLKRGKVQSIESIITSLHLPEHVAERETETIRRKLGLKKKQQEVRQLDSGISEGNFVSILVRSEGITECFGEPGKIGVPAERIAEKVCKQVKKYQKHGAPVGEYLADQLLLPLLLGGGGSFVATEASLHSTTNADVIGIFCDPRVEITQQDQGMRFNVSPLSKNL